MDNVQRLQFEENGYIVFENLFSFEEMDHIRSIIDEYDAASERQLQSSNGGISKQNQINFTAHLNFRHPDLQRFIAHPQLVAISTAILGPDVRLYWDQSVYKRPEAPRDFPWHQDNGYGPIEPMAYLTCWIALDDATIENGCVWVQPGTHRQGLVPHVQTDIGKVCYSGDSEGVPVELRKGSMVAFHSLLFHRSTPNRSRSVTRKAYIAQYSVDGARNPQTGQVFRNGPVIARGGRAAYTGFLTQDQC